MIKEKKLKGFTLIEILISIAVFSIVVTIVTSLYISVSGSQRKSFAQQNVINSSLFAIESISRAVRQSEIINASQNHLTIRHPTKGVINYNRVQGELREQGKRLTSKDVEVVKLSFLRSGLPSGDSIQPRITIILLVKSLNTKPSDDALISLQTTITPRKLQTN